MLDCSLSVLSRSVLSIRPEQIEFIATIISTIYPSMSCVRACSSSYFILYSSVCVCVCVYVCVCMWVFARESLNMWVLLRIYIFNPLPIPRLLVHGQQVYTPIVNSIWIHQATNHLGELTLLNFVEVLFLFLFFFSSFCLWYLSPLHISSTQRIRVGYKCTSTYIFWSLAPSQTKSRLTRLP